MAVWLQATACVISVRITVTHCHYTVLLHIAVARGSSQNYCKLLLITF